ncbi:LysR family transcriptional regulator [Brevibacterium marinum]|uniref:DNA-binding transcriptional LysR family regulator n=2 Tax=Brevibacterium marinum TaxID=418643 RepID=A0A846S0N0_9MICO|nr:LysR family transcriptional regulator [Brevibacterium marinum]NJC56513.1 DNA-binding transcriptional LysR family regulator [Brevibacterium marinum]
MDLIEACRTFTAVSELGSMTLGAEATGAPQPVASRRIAGLEKRFGARLFDRTGRGVSLTPFGQDMLASARRLVDLADTMMLDADRARLRPVSLTVPTSCTTRDLAVLTASASSAGISIDIHSAPPARRIDDLSGRRVRAALRAVPEAEGDWTVPLGCAHRASLAGPVRLDMLRRARSQVSGIGPQLSGKRLRLLVEDNVAHVRDRIRRAAETMGLLPYQVVTDSSDPAAVAAVLGDGDLLLCSAAESRDLGLSWSPLLEPAVVRGYALAATSDDDAEALGAFGEEIADCLGGVPAGTRGAGVPAGTRGAGAPAGTRGAGVPAGTRGGEPSAGTLRAGKPSTGTRAGNSDDVQRRGGSQ